MITKEELEELNEFLSAELKYTTYAISNKGSFIIEHGKLIHQSEKR